MAEFTGWSGSVLDHRAAISILVFANGAFIGAAKPTLSTPGVAQALNAVWLAQSGYSFKLPLGLVQSADRRFNVQIFGVESRVASPLRFACTANTLQDFGC